MAAKALPVEKQVLKVIRRRSAAGGRGGPLRDHDDEARARLGNYAESKFGRVVSASSAGAQGPMQFIPSTWAAYGLGATCTTPTTRSSGRRTTCTPRARRRTTGSRCITTTRCRSTSTP
jgi:hypothetical protein